MKRILYAAGALAIAATLGHAKPEVKPSVTYPTSWAAALAEAKMLNLPIVIHYHGFK